MALVLKLLYKNYSYFMEENQDIRNEHYFLMGSPLKIIAILALYTIFVKRVGPKLMEHRKPFELKPVLLVYNLSQVLVNLWLGLYSLHELIINSPYDDFGCMVTLKGTGTVAMKEATLVYIYFIVKLVDLLDTVFFVLRKRYNQVTFLHFYHHVIICIGSYLVANFLAGGHNSPLGILNSLVHAFMYFYYLVSAIQPDLKKTISWKKYITQLQIAQFFTLIVHNLWPLLFRKNCEFPQIVTILVLIQNVFMATMFINFYIKAYLRKPAAMQLNKDKIIESKST